MIRRALGKVFGCGCESQDAELEALRGELGALRRQVDELQAALRQASPPAVVGSFAEAARVIASGQNVQLGDPLDAPPESAEPPQAAPRGTLVVDLDDCIACGTCVEYCVSAFELDTDGRALVVDQGAPEAEVQAAMDACPTQCIRWDR